MTEESQREPGGIVISGGTVRIGALAQGSGAQASYQQVTDSAGWPSRQEREELEVLLQELLETLRRHDSELDGEPAIRSAVEQVDAELSRERPDRSRIRRLLEKVATAAGPAAEIAAAAATLGRAIAGSA
jgi:hypothetical protein